MITQNNVKQLKSVLEDTLIICNHMIQSREIEKLFTCEKDYRDSKIACKIVPDDYYKLRLFDVVIELKFNNRTKQYYIYLECNNLPFSIKELNEKFKKQFEQFSRPSGYHYNIYFFKDIDFDKCVYYFKMFVRWFLYKQNENEIGLYEDIY